MADDGRRVAVISLGGTIAMTTQTDAGATPTMSANDLVTAVPGLADTGIRVDVHDFRQLPGASLTVSDLLELATYIETLDVDGVVITQGTDTIEESAYLLDLVTSGDLPIVVTGAMRNASMPGADGPANVLAAIRVAASDDVHGTGCVVVFAEEIHAARWVRKTHATSPTAFTSYPGPIGYVAEDRVRITARPTLASLTIDLRGASSPAHTTIYTVGLGDDGTLLNAVGDQAHGVVIAAFGAGHVPKACVDVLSDLAKRMPVILTTRTGSGPVLQRTYGFPGSESDLLERGLISGGTLDPVKARVLLQLLLMAGADTDRILHAFSTV
ncbi:asparaginase [Streptomyces sp. NPDC091879]|uniref:asparaginase n=1 Tax=Streptomyces sp. NPDC091879 TaxID=3366006 RepID=UPI00381B03B8